MSSVRAATAADRATLAASLASAFSEDPLFRWVAGVAPTQTIEPKMRTMFDAFLKVDLAHSDHLVFTDEDGIGGAIWKHPDHWKTPPGDMVRALPGILRALGTKTPRMMSALTAVEKVHPKEE